MDEDAKRSASLSICICPKSAKSPKFGRRRSSPVVAGRRNSTKSDQLDSFLLGSFFPEGCGRGWGLDGHTHCG